MKNNILRLYIILCIALLVACEQEFLTATGNPCPSDDPSIICPPQDEPCPASASAGDADFSKFVVIGSSFSAGFQSGALFNAGQANSLPAILAEQFACVGGGTFNQPDIDSENGFNLFVTPNPMGPVVLGRFLLQGTPPAPTPAISDAQSAPGFNNDFNYTGDKDALNNFSVPVVQLGQAFITQTGNWTLAPDPPFNPFYARFASAPGTSTMIGDAAAALADNGTFFLYWLGMDDVLLYAVFGGDPAEAPLTPLDGATGFTTLYNAGLNTLLGVPGVKGVIANYPDIFTLPHFNLVAYDAIEFTTEDAGTISQVNAGYAQYNGGLDLALAGGFPGLTADEVARRKISFAVGANGIVIEDESLTDLSAMGIPSLRQATEDDKIPLSAGSILGTEATPGDPTTVWGVSKALTDAYALVTQRN